MKSEGNVNAKNYGVNYYVWSPRARDVKQSTTFSKFLVNSFITISQRVLTRKWQERPI